MTNLQFQHSAKSGLSLASLNDMRPCLQGEDDLLDTHWVRGNAVFYKMKAEMVVKVGFACFPKLKNGGLRG